MTVSKVTQHKFSHEAPEVAELTGNMPVVPTEGWAVFKHLTGISRAVDQTEVIDVVGEESQAISIADRLNRTEGVTDYEITGDPESSVYDQTSFGSGYVALTGAEVTVTIAANYALAEPPSTQN